MYLYRICQPPSHTHILPTFQHLRQAQLMRQQTHKTTLSPLFLNVIAQAGGKDNLHNAVSYLCSSLLGNETDLNNAVGYFFAAPNSPHHELHDHAVTSSLSRSACSCPPTYGNRE
jgi:hypothetical protein